MVVSYVSNIEKKKKKLIEIYNEKKRKRMFLECFETEKY